MDLIYFYPKEGGGAPVTVARNLLSEFYKNRDKIPFDIKILSPLQYKDILKDKYLDMEVITVKNFLKTMNSGVFHISTSPLIFPNLKFLMHIIGKLKRRLLIANWQSEPRTEMKYDFRLSRLLQYLFSPLTVRSIDVNIVNSYIMKELFEDKYPDIQRIEVIPNAIESWWLKEVNHDLELKGEPSIFYHGRLESQKGLEPLLKAFAKEVKDAKPHLYIAGGGSKIEQLKKLSVSLEIDERVTFFGHTTRDRIKSYLKTADVSIYPSLYEPFSLAVLEAMAASDSPVFYSETIGMNDFAKRDGYNFETFNPSITGIRKALKSIIDGSVYHSLVEDQKEFVKNYTFEKVAEEYISLYNRIYKVSC